MKKKTEKIYCYVDETGQDTKGRLFIVVAIVVAKEQEAIVNKIEKIERQSRKRKIKWFKTKADIKKAYLDSIAVIKGLENKIYYQMFQDSKSYQDLTCLVTAKAVNRYIEKHHIKQYKATVLIDGLKKTEIGRTSKALRDLGIRIRKVRGVRDQSNAIVRLADAMAGLIRENRGGNQLFKPIVKRITGKRILNELK